MPVIINYADRPCTRLVAIVQKVEAGLVNALYLSKNINLRNCCSPIAGVTPLAEFGVGLRIVDGTFECSVEQASRAQYSDGRIRDWQENDYASQPVCDEAYRIWLSYISAF